MTTARTLDAASLHLDTVDAVLHRAVGNLERLQGERGSWPGDYGGPMFMLPMYVALAWTAKRLPPPGRAARMVEYFFNVQRPDGSIGLHAEATQGSMFTTTLSYVALRLLGVAEGDARLSKMREWVRAHGSPLGAASWGKFTLCLLGLYGWEGIHPLLPELWLLPRGAPFHPGRLWCHARQVYLPMAWLYAARATVPDAPILRALREELYEGRFDAIDWARHRDTVVGADDYRPRTLGLSAANVGQGLFERVPSKLLRRRAMAECLKQLRYEDAVTDDIDLGPVNAVLNMFVHHFRGAEGVADFERGWPKFDRHYLWEGHDGLKMQGYCNSQLWDTAFATQALGAAVRSGAVPSARVAAVLERAWGFVRDNQMTEDVPEARAHYRQPTKGGWGFSDKANGWIVTDCTSEGFVAALDMEGRISRPVSDGHLRDAVRLILSMQNEDGGWASYEKQRGGAWLEQLNPSQVFGDIMVDYSYVECTSACVQALGRARRRFPGEFALDGPIARGADFLRGRQRDDGSFEGSWAVCFTYGTWFGISGLLAAGAEVKDEAIRRAVAFLLSKQRADGAWGEAGDSCRERRWIEDVDGRFAQTAWALSALVRGGCESRDAMARAASWLCARQEPDGSWAREPMVGVFNRSCLITYDNYRHVFPTWALAEWRGLLAGGRP